MKEYSEEVRVIETPQIRTIDPMIGLDNLAVFGRYQKDCCFITPFREEDIKYFKNKMEDLSEEKASADKFFVELSERLARWQQRHSTVRPLEPYLYALKLYAKILIDESGALNMPYLDAVSQAILPYWRDIKDTDVLRHVLVEWNWFQSRAVVIRMYTLKDDISDGVMNQIIQKRLYCGNETEVAFDCLLAHHNATDNLDNLKVLLEFLCQRTHQDKFYPENEIFVDPFLLVKFRRLLKVLPKDAQNELRGYYENHLSHIAGNYSRRHLEKMFYGPPKVELAGFFDAYYRTTGKEQAEAYAIIQKNWNLYEWSHQELCAKIHDDALLQLFHHKISMINAQYASRALDCLTLSASSYAPIEGYIKKQLAKYEPKDNLWMPFALAYYGITGNPSLEEITREFFLHQCGYDCASEIRKRLGDVRHHPGEWEQHSNIVISMAAQLVIPPSTEEETIAVQNFFSGASVLYDFPFCEDKYPDQLDAYVKRAFQYATQEKKNTLLLDTLLDLLGKLTKKRDAYRRYYRMLQKYYDSLPYKDDYRREAVSKLIKSTIRW